jgi:hypothetical protein
MEQALGYIPFPALLAFNHMLLHSHQSATRQMTVSISSTHRGPDHIQTEANLWKWVAIHRASASSTAVLIQVVEVGVVRWNCERSWATLHDTRHIRIRNSTAVIGCSLKGRTLSANNGTAKLRRFSELCSAAPS